MITFKQKEFTDKELAKDNARLIYQAIAHILKICLGFDTKYNLYKHRRDLFNDFLNPILKEVGKKKNKSNGFIEVYNKYLEFYFKRENILKDLRNKLRNNYKLGRDLSEVELDRALDILAYLMGF